MSTILINSVIDSSCSN